MKFSKIPILLGLIFGMSISFAMNEKQLENRQNPLDLVTHIKDIQKLIRDYASEWSIYKTLDYKTNYSLLVSTYADNSISWVNISPDDKHVIFATTENNAVKWDFESRVTENWSIKDYSDINNCIAKTTDNKYIVKATYDQILNRIQIKNYLTNKRLHSFVAHEDSISCIKITSDNKYIVSSSLDGTIKIWDFKGKLINSIVCYTSHKENRKNVFYVWGVYSFAITQDNKYIVSCANDGEIKIWDFNGALIETVLEPTSEKLFLAVSSNGKYIVVASRSSIKILRNLTHDLKELANRSKKNVANQKTNLIQTKCATPGCPKIATKICSLCKKTPYCSVKCQRSQWKLHKKICNK